MLADRPGPPPPPSLPPGRSFLQLAMRITSLAPASLLAGVLLLTSPGASALGDRVDAIVNLPTSPAGSTPTLLTTIELDAGFVPNPNPVDLDAITPGGLPPGTAVEHVGDETWVGTTDGLYRFGGTPLALLGRSLQGERVVTIANAPVGPVVGVVRAVIEVDAQGNQVRRIDTAPNTFTDIDPFQGAYLGTSQDRAYTLTLDYGIVAEFGEDARIRAALDGSAYLPERLTVLDDGRVAIAGLTLVALVRPSGITEALLNPGFFERDVFATGGGQFATGTIEGPVLFTEDDVRQLPSTGGLVEFDYRFYGSRYSTDERGAAGRSCTGTPNSTGAIGRISILASADLPDAALALVATELPAGTVGVPIFGLAPSNTPFGDGRLCVSPLGSGIVRGPIGTASQEGSLPTTFDFSTPGLGAGFTAGTTWHLQVLFRDSGPNGFNGTDAVFITFEP